VNVSNVVRGAFSSANVGYWVAQRWNGRGVATRAVGLVVLRAFGMLGLHRLEAGTLLDNVASQRVLARNGFRPIGVSRRYLHIGGAWRDHLLFARTVEDLPAAAARAPAADTAVVREARPADAATLAALQTAGSAASGTAREDDPGGSAVLVAERDGAVVGRLDLRREVRPAARHVAEVAVVVDPAARRSGVARTLLVAAAAWTARSEVTKLEAYVPPTNVPAVTLFDGLGWRVEGFRPGRLRRGADPIDALVLGLDLEESPRI